jgi:hypothetical protein
MQHPLIITMVGSRKAPHAACEFMARQSLLLRKSDILVRTGDAPKGIDHAIVHPELYFEITDPDEIELSGSNTFLEVYTPRDAVDDDDALNMAKRFHKAWNLLSPHAELLHARNCYQVAGLELTRPSTVLVCWTPDGITHHKHRTVKTGGTGTAISVASAMFDIPVYNLNSKKSFREYNSFITSLKLEHTT